MKMRFSFLLALFLHLYKGMTRIGCLYVVKSQHLRLVDDVSEFHNRVEVGTVVGC